MQKNLRLIGVLGALAWVWKGDVEEKTPSSPPLSNPKPLEISTFPGPPHFTTVQLIVHIYVPLIVHLKIMCPTKRTLKN